MDVLGQQSKFSSVSAESVDQIRLVSNGSENGKECDTSNSNLHLQCSVHNEFANAKNSANVGCLFPEIPAVHSFNN